MKINLKIWDVLSIVVLLATVVIIIVVFSVFNDPTSSLNPFPPATLPPTIDVPTSTYTPVRLPPTWTPIPSVMPTMRPSSTPVPSATPVILP